MIFPTILRTLGIIIFFPPLGAFRQFFGMIGPNLRIKNINNLFDLFTGDGVIQSAFFENTTASIKFYRHIVETNVYRMRTRTITSKWLMQYAMHKMRMIPTNNGVANTALLTIPLLSNSTITYAYALFERDLPYLLQINHLTGLIKTVGPVKSASPKLLTMSGHTKRYNTTHLDTIDYHMFSKKVVYHQLEERIDSASGQLNLVSKKSIPIKTRYLPIIHDFATTKHSIILTDSPLKYDFRKIFHKKLPVVFDKSAHTEIHVVNKVLGETQMYSHPDAFYIFHYAAAQENNTHIEILAPVYDDLDFSSIIIYGRYRKIIIDKRSRVVKIIKNPDLEKLNLDFPVDIGNKCFLFRNIKNTSMNGFVIVDHELIIQNTLTIPSNYSLCGEPGYDGSSKIVAFLYDEHEMGSFYTLDLKSGIESLIPLNTTMTPGFHSMTS
jgi:carotenoid cleavage dioxygenase-like enzyme